MYYSEENREHDDRSCRADPLTQSLERIAAEHEFFGKSTRDQNRYYDQNSRRIMEGQRRPEVQTTPDCEGKEREAYEQESKSTSDHKLPKPGLGQRKPLCSNAVL